MNLHYVVKVTWSSLNVCITTVKDDNKAYPDPSQGSKIIRNHP